jgi:predicted TIM-barrel fold metal-dependent hydrolase
VNRRSFLSAAAGAALAVERAGAAPIPIIDTHIHLFDPTRPQGVPWPPKDNAVLYKPALPERFRKIATPLGVRGAIKVEASPWLEDNQWVLDVAEKDPIIVGVVGNLEPGKPEFSKHLERFHKNPLFLGIRYGNLWGRVLGGEIGKREFVSDLKLLSQADLSLDSANPNPDLIAALVRLTDEVPKLRVVIDHLPQMRKPTDPAIARTYEAHLRELGKRPQVYVKLSEVFRRVDGQVPRDLSVYRGTLDEIFGIFGEDRVLFGSDWPNSDNWRPYEDVLSLVQEYFAGKGGAAAEKYFWKNSVKAYRWVKRDATQPSA